jgi:hypothetical protein
MTDAELIAAALANLDRYSLRINTRDVSAEVAALIRAVDQMLHADPLPMYNSHDEMWAAFATNDALIALCRAIVGQPTP